MSRTILITGASTGIGAATALELASENVVILHYNQSYEATVAVAKAVREKGGVPHMVQADLMTEGGCRQLMVEVVQLTDHLDVLVNNAGGLVKRQGVSELDWEVMAQIFALNTFSTMLLTRLSIPFLKKGEDPSIINMTSVAMRSGAPTATVYGASKGAVDSFTRGSARELAPHIRVNAIAPGVIVTPFHEKYTTPERMERFKELAPLKEHGTSEQIARAVRFLVENRFITGETIDINGGLFMR